MTTLTKPFFSQTAMDLMTREIPSVSLGMHLRDAIRKLFQVRVHAAAVVDAAGQCVGILSMTDLARWALHQTSPPVARPRTCRHQEILREATGEVILCTLSPGLCPLQTSHTNLDGTVVISCSEPHCVPVDWQMVEMESLPKEDVQHYMTSNPVTAVQGESVRSLAKKMTDFSISQIIVVDDQKVPIGMVSWSHLIAAMSDAISETSDFFL